MNDVRNVNIGVLGLGAISQVVHLPILSQLEGVRLMAVCDVDHAKARMIAARFGIPRVPLTDEQVFQSADLDAIVICTPSHLHHSQAKAALQAGKHVLVEKPLALDAETARDVVEVAESAGLSLMVAMNNRYRPDAAALRPFVRGGELGEIFLVRGAWLNRKMRILRPTWRHRRATAGGGALMDLGVQTIDLALWLLDYPSIESIACSIHKSEGFEVEDTAALLMRVDNGCTISLTVGWSLVAERDRQYLRVLGTRGSGAMAPLAVFKELETGMVDVTPRIVPGRENLYTASYRQEMEHFLACVRGEEKLPVPREQIEIMRLVALAYRSASERREVPVQEG